MLQSDQTDKMCPALVSSVQQRPNERMNEWMNEHTCMHDFTNLEQGAGCLLLSEGAKEGKNLELQSPNRRAPKSQESGNVSGDNYATMNHCCLANSSFWLEDTWKPKGMFPNILMI